ncbi:nuclear pore complex protein Nup85-like [Varroa jacobsoni]|uniref:nuclear pore complex protein Nup85-like n=1 Tax=Varroa jacobsoni TaxID=62625 RepID=UPI000BF5B942|nr:nuclear pore complex protein Nup85-like [Varroa jacobsoni]XP_022697632.1 nuclear pore complex protein Nup85-like [Varroa jacobsoni]XP_022697643.1 nuclear pore complex protein Nup85-like [Varroa jacobsoni]
MATQGAAPLVALAGALDVVVTSPNEGSERSRPIHTLSFVSSRIDGPLRMFIAHTAGVYIAFKTSLEEKGDKRQLISRFSKLYRSALAQLNESRASEGAPPHVFRAVESVWHLCEILILDPQPAPGVLIQQLQQWAAAWSSSPAGKRSPKAVPGDDGNDESFWDNFTTLVMLGQIEDACSMLRSHGSGDTEDFVLMTQILLSMPLFGQDVYMEFLTKWNEWQETVRQLVQGERFQDEPRFYSVCRLLYGSPQEFDRRKDLCDSWFQFVVTKAAYSQPLLKVADLAKLADEVLASKDFFSGDSLSQLVLSLLHGDLQAFTRLLANLDDLWWTGAHLVDLLREGGDLQSRNVPHVEALHEQLLRDYALCLLSQRPLWQTGLMYLHHCKPENRPMLIQAVISVHCSTQQKALKVAAVAENLGLPEATFAIYRMQSVKWLKQNKLDSALVWAIRSKNSPLVSRVAEMLLEDYLRSGTLICADQLRGLGQEMLVSERLMFLAKYAEFLRLRDECCNNAGPDNLEGAARAAELLLFLVNSEWSPRFFVVRLLEDAVQLLGDDNLVPQNIAYLQRLMACLQSTVKRRPGELKKDLLDKLNFACAKRTAQSLLYLMQIPNENVMQT